MLGRTLGLLAGLVTRLDPEFNVFEEAEPFARRLLEEEPWGWVEQILEAAWGILRTPLDLQRFLERSLRGELQWRATFPEARETLSLIAEGFQRLIWQLTGLVWVMMGLFAGLNHQPALAGVLLGIGGLWLLWGLRPLRRRREGGG